MTTLAFLQNQWLRDPERVKRLIAQKGPAYRRRLLAFALFAGCLTGRRLKAAFGDAYSDIIWEEASPEIGGRASAAFPADLDHMRAAIREHQPRIIITFGKIATDAMASLRPEFPGPDVHWWSGPHPAARHATVCEQLATIARCYHKVTAEEAA